MGVIGTDRVADGRLPALRRRPEVGLAGVCHLDEHLLRRVARICGLSYCRAVGEMLAPECPEIVDVTTAPHTHVDLLCDAIEARCARIMLEKPATLGASALRELLNVAARASGETVATGSTSHSIDSPAYPCGVARPPYVKWTSACESRSDSRPYRSHFMGIRDPVFISEFRSTLRGWSRYLRAGSATITFGHVNRLVLWKPRLLIKQWGRDLRAGVAARSGSVSGAISTVAIVCVALSASEGGVTMSEVRR